MEWSTSTTQLAVVEGGRSGTSIGRVTVAKSRPAMNFSLDGALALAGRAARLALEDHHRQGGMQSYQILQEQRRAMSADYSRLALLDYLIAGEVLR